MTYQRIAALVALIFTLSGCGSATLDTSQQPSTGGSGNVRSIDIAWDADGNVLSPTDGYTLKVNADGSKTIVLDP